MADFYPIIGVDDRHISIPEEAGQHIRQIPISDIGESTGVLNLGNKWYLMYDATKEKWGVKHLNIFERVARYFFGSFSETRGNQVIRDLSAHDIQKTNHLAGDPSNLIARIYKVILKQDMTTNAQTNATQAQSQELPKEVAPQTEKSLKSHSSIAEEEMVIEESQSDARYELISEHYSSSEGIEDEIFIPYPNGNTYMGAFNANEEPHGKGTMTYKKENAIKENDRWVYEYTGEFKDGKWDGLGKVILDNGDTYEGQFKDGQPVGPGELTQHHSKFPGEYKDIFKNEW